MHDFVLVFLPRPPFLFYIGKYTITHTSYRDGRVSIQIQFNGICGKKGLVKYAKKILACEPLLINTLCVDLCSVQALQHVNVWEKQT